MPSYMSNWHSSCYPHTHTHIISHSSSYMSWTVIHSSLQLSIHRLPVIFYNCLFRILNDGHRINLDSTLVSSSYNLGKVYGIVHRKFSNKNTYQRVDHNPIQCASNEQQDVCPRSHIYQDGVTKKLRTFLASTNWVYSIR